MKTTITVLLILGTTIILRAQIPESNYTFQKKELQDYIKYNFNQNSINTFQFKSDTSTFVFKSFNKYYYQDNPNNKPFINGNRPAEFRMPVAKDVPYSMDMPVLVPDSAVHYYMKEKRIHFVNPKELNTK